MADLLSILLPDYPPLLLVYIYCVFLVAGVVKGFLGMGMPAVLMAMLTLFIPPIEAIPLIILPMLCTNMYQFGRAKDHLAIIRRYWVFGFFTITAVTVVSANIRNYPDAVLLMALGIVMMLFSVSAVSRFALRLGPHIGWQIVGGLASGIIGGLSAVWSPPVGMYLLARNVAKDEFIAASGFIFLLGCIGINIALGSTNLLTAPVALQSLIGLVIALSGFAIGEQIRNRVSGEVFKKWLLAVFFILGLRLVVVSLIQ